MIHKHVTPWSMTLACMLLVSSGTAMAQRAYLIVDRTTGAAEATSSAAIPVHGYSITSTSGLLDVEAWSSLQEQGAAGWTEANPNANQLTEFTLEPGGLQPGTNVGLGALFTVGAATLPREEDLQFQVTVPASDPTVPGDVIDGVVVYTGPSSVPTITVNRESGNIELTNTGGFPVDAYSISSESGLLDPAGMAEVPGFRASNPTANLVTGLNFEGSASFPATVNLGNVFKADGVVGIENEDLTFAYTVPGNTEEFTGVVEYTGAVNDLVLQVNELTGAASIQHMSPNVGAVEITGYSILSDGGSLDSSAWNKIGGNFREANPGDSALAEINLTGGMMFANGTSHAMGNIFAGSSRDLVFEYSTRIRIRTLLSVPSSMFLAIRYRLVRPVPTCEIRVSLVMPMVVAMLVSWTS